MDINEIEDRFIALESVAAEYERTIKDLNQIVAEQALKIDRLQRDVFFCRRILTSAAKFALYPKKRGRRIID